MFFSKWKSLKKYSRVFDCSQGPFDSALALLNNDTSSDFSVNVYNSSKSLGIDLAVKNVGLLAWHHWAVAFGDDTKTVTIYLDGAQST